ncbi:MAG TPA: thioesterase family protein [Candidatus Binatia bacterium]|nr:thioesterase family protein [Candidatus Binatia bacterium]
MSLPRILDSLRAVPVGARLWRGDIAADWNAPVYPNGGLTTAVAVRAMEMELDQPHQRLRNVSTMFVSTVPCGPVDIAVERLRVGKRMSQLRADVRSSGSAERGHLVTAAFGESREGFEFEYLKAPEVGPPLDYPPPATPPPGHPTFNPPFFQNVEVRRVKMFSSFEKDWVGGTAEAIRWIRFRTPPRRADASIDPLSLIALADTMPPSIAQYIGPGFPFFHAPSVDLNVRMFADPEDEWILGRMICHWAGDGYASAEIALWDIRRRLVAHANQMMLIRLVTPGELGRK